MTTANQQFIADLQKRIADLEAGVAERKRLAIFSKASDIFAATYETVRNDPTNWWFQIGYQHAVGHAMEIYAEVERQERGE